MVGAATKIAYAQVDDFLSLIEAKYIEMIPRNIRYFIKQEKDENYDKKLDPTIPMKNQNLCDEALALIAYLNLNYWCQDEEEKKKLTTIYEENEKKYQDELNKDKKGTEELFKEENSEDDMMISSTNDISTNIENNIFKKIIWRIKLFFK